MAIVFTDSGDPLTHPRILEMIQIVPECNVAGAVGCSRLLRRLPVSARRRTMPIRGRCESV